MMAGTPTPKADAIRAMREAKAERIEAAKAKSRPRIKTSSTIPPIWKSTTIISKSIKAKP